MDTWIQDEFENIRDSAFETRVLRMNRKNISYLQWIPTRCEELLFQENNLEGLPDLSNHVRTLNVSRNRLTRLPSLLPQHLKFLDVSENPALTALPELPEGLEVLRASNCGLTHLPKLPTTLKYLYVHNNYLTELPELPKGLDVLSIFNNCIQDLSKLPSAIHSCKAQPQTI
jgi:Leucine-rich repeat (LRR) protein